MVWRSRLPICHNSYSIIGTNVSLLPINVLLVFLPAAMVDISESEIFNNKQISHISMQIITLHKTLFFLLRTIGTPESPNIISRTRHDGPYRFPGFLFLKSRKTLKNHTKKGTKDFVVLKGLIPMSCLISIILSILRQLLFSKIFLPSMG